MSTLLAWTPGPDIVDHYARPLASEMEFFTPPPEIGRVLTAFSTLRANKPRPSLLKSLLAALGAFAGGFVGGYALGWIKSGSREGWECCFAGALLGIILAGMAYYTTARAGQCTYVGERGMARCFHSIYTPNAPKIEVLTFEHAAQLLAGQVDQYSDGGYTRTNFNYRWLDANGKALMIVQGLYNRKKMEKTGLPASMEFGYVERAEGVWLALAFARAQEELSKFGYATFRLGATGEARVGRDYVEVHPKAGSVTRFEGSNIAKLEVNMGSVILQARDAQHGVFGVGRHGIFTVKYALIGNARLFLYLVNRLGGYDPAPLSTSGKTNALR